MSASPSSSLINDDDEKFSSPPSTSSSSWEELPLELFYEILSFLPMLPYFFKLSRVNKAWSSILQYLMERAGDDDNYYLHLNFGYVNPSNMEYNDLITIIEKCRGVKRITLSNMKVTGAIMRALELTQVETLIISQCEFDSSLGLDLSKFSEAPNRYSVYGWGYGYKALTELVEKKVKTSSKRFDNLKTIALFDSTNCRIYTSYYEKVTAPPTAYYYHSTKSLPINLENICVQNVETLDFSKLVLGSKDMIPNALSVIAENRPVLNVVSVNSTSNSQGILNFKQIPQIDIGTSVDNVYQFLKRNELLVGFDTVSLQRQVDFPNFVKGLELFNFFRNTNSIILEHFEKLNELAPSLDPTVVTSFNLTKFTESRHFQFLLLAIPFINNTPNIKEEFAKASKAPCLKICKELDKRFKYYQSKTKAKEEIFIVKLWTHFLETGETSKPSTKRKVDEKQTTNKKKK